MCAPPPIAPLPPLPPLPPPPPPLPPCPPSALVLRDVSEAVINMLPLRCEMHMLSNFQYAMGNPQINLGRFMNTLERLVSMYTSIVPSPRDIELAMRHVEQISPKENVLSPDGLERTRSKIIAYVKSRYGNPKKFENKYLKWIDVLYDRVVKAAERNGYTIYVLMYNVMLPHALKGSIRYPQRYSLR